MFMVKAILVMVDTEEAEGMEVDMDMGVGMVEEKVDSVEEEQDSIH